MEFPINLLEKLTYDSEIFHEEIVSRVPKSHTTPVGYFNSFSIYNS